MKNAPLSVLHALFDAAMAVDDCMITVFEHHHPDAPDAFRTWCRERGRPFRTTSRVVTMRGEYQVIGIDSTTDSRISIHLDGHVRTEAA